MSEDNNPSPQTRYPNGVEGIIEWLRRQAEKAFAVKNDALCNNFHFAADALEYLEAQPSRKNVTCTISRRDLLKRMSFALDDLSPDETIGFNNGVSWIEVATVEEIRRAAHPSPKTKKTVE